MATEIGGDGNDVLIGTSGADELYGGAGDDTIFAFEGDDFVDGGPGDDSIDSDGDNDVVYGGEGNDFIDAGDGDDFIDGGPGNDTLIGGTGNDTYVFAPGYGVDVVSDAGGNDTVLLTGGLKPSDVQLVRSGNNLEIVIQASGERLVLSDWFLSSASRVESISFSATETMLDEAAIQQALANGAPVAADDLAAVTEDGAAATGNVLANDSDPEGDALAVTNEGTYQGTYGTLMLASDGSYTYTLDSSLPAVQALAAGQTVSDLFAYSVTDGVSLNPLGANAQLTVMVNGANDAPILAAPLADQSAQAGQAFSFAVPAGTFTDVDSGDSLALGATLADGSALPGWLAFDTATRTFTGTAPQTSGGTALQIQVTATDLLGAQASDAFALAVAAAPPVEPPPVETPPAEAPLGRHIVGTRRKDRLVGTSGDDLIEGRDGNDRLRGMGGVDILQGGKGNDRLEDRDGNTVFDGGRGNDRMTGGRDDDFFAGGRGNDKLYLGGGHDVVAFNKGDGVDHLYGERQDGVLSLGGGIRYEDLRFSKDGSDLVLKTGGGDRLVFEDWYRGKQSIVTLQVVAEAMAGFSQNSHDPLRDDRIETFDFRKLVQAYDDARACQRNLQNWKLMNELLDAHLGGSDSAAYGGDLAYRYGMTGTLAGMGWTAARDTVAAPEFGNEMQALHSSTQIQADPVKLGS